MVDAEEGIVDLAPNPEAEGIASHQNGLKESIRVISVSSAALLQIDRASITKNETTFEEGQASSNVNESVDESSIFTDETEKEGNGGIGQEGEGVIPEYNESNGGEDESIIAEAMDSIFDEHSESEHGSGTESYQGSSSYNPESDEEEICVGYHSRILEAAQAMAEKKGYSLDIEQSDSAEDEDAYGSKLESSPPRHSVMINTDVLRKVRSELKRRELIPDDTNLARIDSDVTVQSEPDAPIHCASDPDASIPQGDEDKKMEHNKVQDGSIAEETDSISDESLEREPCNIIINQDKEQSHSENEHALIEQDETDGEDKQEEDLASDGQESDSDEDLVEDDGVDVDTKKDDHGDTEQPSVIYPVSPAKIIYSDAVENDVAIATGVSTDTVSIGSTQEQLSEQEINAPKTDGTKREAAGDIASNLCIKSSASISAPQKMTLTTDTTQNTDTTKSHRSTTDEALASVPPSTETESNGSIPHEVADGSSPYHTTQNKTDGGKKDNKEIDHDDLNPQNTTSFSDLSESFRQGDDSLELVLNHVVPRDDNEKTPTGQKETILEGTARSQFMFDTGLPGESSEEDIDDHEKCTQSISKGSNNKKNHAGGNRGDHFGNDSSTKSKSLGLKHETSEEADGQGGNNSEDDDSTQSISLGLNHDHVRAEKERDKDEYFNGENFGSNTQGIRFVRLNDSNCISFSSVIADPNDYNEESQQFSFLMSSVRKNEKARRPQLTGYDSDEDVLWIGMADDSVAPEYNSLSISTIANSEPKQKEAKKKKKKVAKMEWLASVAADESNEVHRIDCSQMSASSVLGTTLSSGREGYYRERPTSTRSTFRKMKENRKANIGRGTNALRDNFTTKSGSSNMSVSTDASGVSSEMDSQKNQSLAELRKGLEAQVSARLKPASWGDSDYENYMDDGHRNFTEDVRKSIRKSIGVGALGSLKEGDSDSEGDNKKDDEVDLEKGNNPDDDTHGELEDGGDAKEQSTIVQMCVACKEKICSRVVYIISAAITLGLVVIGNIVLIVFLAK